MGLGLSSCKKENGVTIKVVTSYGEGDGNYTNYINAVKEWEEKTGNKVDDDSTTSDENWKSKVLADFDQDKEPDVLFYFVGTDADKIVNSGKVMSLDSIKAEYPKYASNMNTNIIPASTADGQKYIVPSTGFWEALYVNKAVLEAAGVAVPDSDYTWDQFLTDSAQIKAAGYTPIAASLSEIPHYWWEYAIYNNGSVGAHLQIPILAGDAASIAWDTGLDDIKMLYDSGIFPSDTLTASDEDMMKLLVDGKAAFAIDGSWKIGWFQEKAADHLDDFVVSYVPAKADRKATDIIGGFSMGYYITKKAWDDADRREAAIDFIEHMTSDSVIARFSNNGVAPTALLTPPKSEDSSPFIQSASDMFRHQTSAVPAVQDLLSSEAKTVMFGGVAQVMVGAETPQALVDSVIAIENE